MIKIAVDAMGGDFAPEEIVKGVNIAISEIDDIEIMLFGDEEQIKKYLIPNDRVTVVHAPSKVDMGEKDPIGEIRRNRESSLVKSFEAVKNNVVSGVVTAGPTQAVIPAAHLVIRRIKGMKRVALCPELPAINGKGRLLLDVGANVELKSEHIVQLAEYASIYLKEVKGVKEPIVGLVNIGSEPGKGREQDKETFNLLSENKNIKFYGNVEPKEMFYTECDILINDGFTGNVMLKTCEGTAKAMSGLIKSEVKKSLMAKIGYLFMRNVFKTLKKTMSSDEVGGATLFGVDGVVVKAHGASNADAIYHAINRARLIVKGDVVNKMKAILGENNE